MLDISFIVTVFIIFFALAFDFINGFHDTANAVATAVSTKSLTPRRAILLASCMNFLGAMTFTGVAKTITQDIVDPFQLKNGAIVILAALIAAIFWNLLTWYYGLPSSSSHTLIGSIAGAAVAAAGFQSLHYSGFLKIVQALLVSPLFAFSIGFVIYSLLKVFFKKSNSSKTNQNFRAIQVFTTAFQSYTHGTNDAQKSMGIITMALIAGGYQQTTDIPFWVQLSCAVAMGLGTSVGGWRIIQTVGSKIIKIRPANGVAADLSSSIIIFTATLLHLPVSTTHVVSSSIMGVGSAHRIKSVNWSTAQQMLVTWLVTLPVSAAIASICYFFIDQLL